MTRAEGPFAGNSRRLRRFRHTSHSSASSRAALLVALLASSALVPLLTTWSASSEGAVTAIGTLRSQAAQLATEVDTAQAKLEILGEEYDQAQTRQSQLAQQIVHDRGALSAARSSVQLDTQRLHNQAVFAYVNAGSAESLSAVLSSNANVLPLQQTYLGVASASLDGAISILQDSEHALTVRATTLATAESEANSAATALGASQRVAATVEANLASTLAGVRGSLGTAVAQQESLLAAQRSAAEAAASIAPNAAAATTNEGGVSGPPLSTATSVSGNSGSIALQAAESQLGVPYVWAGDSPGGGFDCSGLTMWAWSKAGVNLAHSAEEQYNEIEHIPFSELQPGDLIFYASGGYVYHVIMYAGGGRAIQAIDSGTAIQYTPVWPGAIGAGRP